MAKCLYYAPRLFPKGDGVSNKVYGQVKGFISNGVSTELLFFNAHGKKTDAVINDKVLFTFKNEWQRTLGILTFYRFLLKYILDNGFDILYVRYELNATPSFIWFLSKLKKKGVKVLLEIPTYPYDSEIKYSSIKTTIKRYIEKQSRKYLKNGVTNIVSTSIYENILGIDTINISNAVDESMIKLHHHTSSSDKIFVMIGVAFIAPWHGYDRIIEGMGEYYLKQHSKDVLLYLVGDGDNKTIENLKLLVEKYNLSEKVIFTGPKYGEELDALFDLSDIAIGSLARHRSGNSSLKTLKNVEYAMRGIPFIYSEDNSDFDSAGYILKVPADDSSVSINDVVDFWSRIKYKYSSEQIRNSVERLTWKVQISKIIQQIG